MNYLQLAKRLAIEGGSGSNITTVTSQSGEAGRMANWIAAAWDDLQLERPDWYWMRGSFSFTATSGDGAHSSTDAGITSRFGQWDVKSIRCYQSSVNDELLLNWLPYEDFRSAYLIGAQSNSRPVNITISPSLGLMLGPKPNASYVISGEYFKSPKQLATDAEDPELPSQFHMAIVYRALMLYARYEAAPEIYADAELNYKRFLRRIELNQLPTIEIGGTLT